MKAIVLTRFGEPEKVLELKTLPDPTPPGPGEVVVRVAKRQLHPGNLAMVRGKVDALRNFGLYRRAALRCGWLAAGQARHHPLDSNGRPPAIWCDCQ
jgi:NADPH:quinone reductase-like Zn-dependent oxidoreductase